MGESRFSAKTYCNLQLMVVHVEILIHKLQSLYPNMPICSLTVQ